ncbi:putative ketopantoate reductase ApbA/PanE, 6-phosphogluconate dehydrogenase-like domain superfamily [Acrodontium crateriforme]|uniref:2-dehydropantoate 2-reductase n=1 Tax=Acrodontium crateriforme TaxID=150365 RepID=A0AAQ3M709_9PEZI|nr:putative ketopantoate reductase ApbA/PanE, 6-phosphogluconate dehydrogenase-like domain superfamily [Acrodontium crateriforme]
MPIRVLLVGAGAIGAFYGSRLATAPNTLVSALCRSNFRAVKDNGFHVSSPKYGNSTFRPEYAFSNPGEARKAQIKWDYLLVATKALPDLSDDSELLEGLVGPETSIVLVQNGLGVEEPYRKRFPKATVLSAVTIASAAQPSHGKIQHNRWTRISIGPYLPHLDKEGTEESSEDEQANAKNSRFVELLREGGIEDAELYSHAGLQFVRWHKIAINAAMNPSSVLSGGSENQAMALDPELSRHLLAVMEEVLDTAPRVLGKPLPDKLASPQKILESTKKNTSGSKPSMQLDWAEGKRMELEVILGNPIRIAREKGIEMPRLQSMYALLKMAQENRQKQSKL